MSLSYTMAGAHQSPIRRIAGFNLVAPSTHLHPIDAFIVTGYLSAFSLRYSFKSAKANTNDSVIALVPEVHLEGSRQDCRIGYYNRRMYLAFLLRLLSPNLGRHSWAFCS